MTMTFKSNITNKYFKFTDQLMPSMANLENFMIARSMGNIIGNPSIAVRALLLLALDAIEIGRAHV